MRMSVIISALLHVAILAYAIVGFASPRDFKAKPPKPISVDILTTEEFSKLTAGQKTKKPADKKPPEQKKKPPKKEVEKKKKNKKKAVRAPSPSEPPKITPAPKPKKVEKKKPEKKLALKKAPKPKPEKKKTEPPKRKPKTKKVKKKKKKFDSDDIAALLNKIPDAGAPDKPKPKPKPTETAKKTSGDGGVARRAAQSAGAQAVRRVENECWNIPVGGRDVENLVVRVKFRLDKEGNLQGAPRVLNPPSGPAAQAVYESAKRAVLACQPFYEFPSRVPKNYQIWKELTLNFDMSRVYGN